MEKGLFWWRGAFQKLVGPMQRVSEVMVDEVDSTGYKCFEEGGEKLYSIWVKTDAVKEDDLFQKKFLSEIKDLRVTVRDHQMADEVNRYLKEERE